jgi:hypothetical protein
VSCAIQGLNAAILVNTGGISLLALHLLTSQQALTPSHLTPALCSASASCRSTANVCFAIPLTSLLCRCRRAHAVGCSCSNTENTKCF